MLERWRGGWRNGPDAEGQAAASGTEADARRSAARDAVGRVHCETCQHYAPLACVVAVIRWGADTSSDKLRQCARCSACDTKGATIQHPGWAGNNVGFLPFPAEKLVQTI